MKSVLNGAFWFFSFVCCQLAVAQSTPYLIKDIDPSSEGPTLSAASDRASIIVDEILYFASDDGVHGGELWRSDGTTAGTYMVKDIQPGPNGSYAGSFIGINGEIFFTADNGVTRDELWRSDGTESGTTLFFEFNPGIGDGNPRGYQIAGSRVFLTASDGVNGKALWAFDIPPSSEFTVPLRKLWILLLTSFVLGLSFYYLRRRRTAGKT